MRVCIVTDMRDSARRIALKPQAISGYCKAEGISRDELARRMGVSTMTAYRLDAGQNEPSPKFIAAFMDITGKRFEDLFEIVGESAA